MYEGIRIGGPSFLPTFVVARKEGSIYVKLKKLFLSQRASQQFTNMKQNYTVGNQP